MAAIPTTITRFRLRAGSPIPKKNGSGCPGGAPQIYILQSFGVEVSAVDSYDSLIGLLGSEVMQGLQNYEDTDAFRAHAFTRISYNGTPTRDTDGNQIFRGSEEHTEEWVSEEDSGLVWFK